MSGDRAPARRGVFARVWRGIAGGAVGLGILLAPSVLLFVLLGFVTPAHAARPPRVSYAPAAPSYPQPRITSGAIYDPANGYAALYEGVRARAVGDPLTIRLVETTTTSKTVSSKSAKNGNASITPPTSGPLGFLNPNALTASSTSAFNGEGQAAQTSSLDATLAVTIAEVRGNGTALVRGEKRLLLSQGHEWIQFSGIVRLIDIDQDNYVPSTRVADAHVEYSGKGALQQSSRQGWLGRFFNIISPF